MDRGDAWAGVTSPDEVREGDKQERRHCLGVGDERRGERDGDMLEEDAVRVSKG